MLDFLKIAVRSVKKDEMVIYPKFVVGKPTDLMIRGGDFYAVWIEELGLWSTNELDALRLIDRELREYKDSNPEYADYSIAYMWDADSGSIDRWHKYCQQQMRDSFRNLDEKLIFSNHVTVKEDYASKRLNYPLEKGDLPAFKKLISTLYSKEERLKIEWAIGAIVSGDSTKIQKFMVFYGAAGTGKSTILNIIQMLFEGYYSVFDAQALGSRSNQFALEPFRTNPLVAIQHDGDLSRIEDNTRLNSLISHEEMTVNEKFKATYYNSFKCFLFMGTNKPVKITDAKSGILRRLIDVTPSGNKLDPREYKTIMKQVTFELGAIAYHCLEVYMKDPGRYDDYIPVSMLDATNDFYNYVVDSYPVFAKEDATTLKAAWEMFLKYSEDTKMPYTISQRIFKEELKNYFRDYEEKYVLPDGTRVRSYYSGFRVDKLGLSFDEKQKSEEPKPNLIEFKEQESILDKYLADCPAQYATTNGTPYKAWDKVTTKLSDIDTHKLHYVRGPENHIFIDFDLRDETGKKSLKRNLEEASKWPATYAELSKSGEGVHLHYIYNGDVSMLSHVYDDQIEVKNCLGKSPIRRMLTKCNNLPIATISSGLPLKGDDKLINFEGLKNERALRTVIKRNLNKEYHANTTPSVEFIARVLEDAYNGGMKYDVSDLYNDILAFAANASNQAEKCMKLVDGMKFKSEDPSLPDTDDEALLVFYDVEVFPNLFLVNYKAAGKGKSVVRLINPTSAEIEQLLRYNLVGFNCRDYDNHILYGRLIGYDNARLYDLSQRIINKDKAISQAAKFGEAYNISYTDVYDFSTDKKSLKKWEIELGIHHKELGLPWDQPVPKERWTEVAEYCDNDVIATEILFYHLEADWTARQILAKLSGLTVNDKTNSHSGRFIFGNNRNPQSQFNWRNMGVLHEDDTVLSAYDEYTRFTKDGKPVFPGYKYEFGKSIYRGEEVGEGGYVHAEPGMYGNVALLDVASMHPSSAIAEVLFGPEFTRRFEEIKDARVAIKHKDFDKAKTMLNGALAEFLTDPNMAKALANALKIVINSVYGLTAASFPNLFKDPRNVDNIVAKRGALFMVNLKHEVQKRGFKVIHIKTDSIKIADATPEIIKFVMNYGKLYGYTFEHEATYDRICLVNDAVYIAQYPEGEWTATGKQFQVPYIFKKLFSKEEIVFNDLCENKSVQTALYLDINESLPDVSAYEKELKKRRTGKAKKPTPEFVGVTDEELEAKIAEGHNYRFVGKVGNFCPIKPGHGGGILLRQTNTGGFASATGADGYRWLESEIVQGENEKFIDYSYFNKLVDDAIDKISEFGDYEWFVSGDPYIGPEYDPNGRPIYGAIELFKDELDDCLVAF